MCGADTSCVRPAKFFKGCDVMDLDRAKELLNALIEKALVGDSIYSVIQDLLHVGFTEDELVNEFGFDDDDVKDAAKDMEYYVED